MRGPRSGPSTDWMGRGPGVSGWRIDEDVSLRLGRPSVQTLRVDSYNSGVERCWKCSYARWSDDHPVVCAVSSSHHCLCRTARHLRRCSSPPRRFHERDEQLLCCARNWRLAGRNRRAANIMCGRVQVVRPRRNDLRRVRECRPRNTGSSAS